MVTQTKPTPTETNTPVRESENRPMPTNRTGVQVVDLPSRFREKQTSTGKSRNLPARIGHRMSTFYDWMAGPPATAQERMNSAVVDAKHQMVPFSASHRQANTEGK